MKLSLWLKIKRAGWVPLTHFPDGAIGLTMDEAVKLKLLPPPGYDMGMGKLQNKFFYDGGSRFLVLEKEESIVEGYRRAQE